MSVIDQIFEKAKQNPQKVAFPEALNEKMMEAAYQAGENGYIYYDGHSTIFDSYDLNLRGKESIHKDFHNSDKFYDTFTEFKEIYENNDYAKCEEYLKLSLMIQKVLDDLRLSADIVYADDNK